MKRRKGEIAMAAAVFGVGGVAVVGALQHPYYSEYGPGAGLFPFWLGIALAGLAVVLLAVIARAPVPEDSGRRFTQRQAWVVSLFVAYILALNWLGFAVSTAAFLLAVLCVVEGRSWREGLLVAGAGTLFCLAFFQWWFEVPLPPGVLFGEP